MIETTERDGIPATRLSTPEGLAATVVPAGGMVGVSLTDDGVELLGQRSGLAAYVSDAKTLGIPLLHPWANRLARDTYEAGGVRVELPPRAPGLRRDANGLAIHGLLAGSPLWREVAPVGGGAAGGAGAALSAELDFGARPELLASFPFPHRLRIDVTLRARTLTIATTLTATGDVAVPLAYGFHPYLALPDVPRAEWEVELPAMRALALDARGIPTGDSRTRPASTGPLGGQAFDDAFADLAPGATFAVSGGGRRVTVRFERGFGAAQVYAPLDDDVVCFEPMAAPTDALVSGDGLRLVAPGEHDETVFSISVENAR